MNLQKDTPQTSSETRSDEQLCLLAAQNDRAAEEELVMRYYATVRCCARPLTLMGGDAEDLIQEGMFGLLRAIREYDSGKAASFHTFAEVCIRNRLISALREDSRQKNAMLNRSLSLDAPYLDSQTGASETVRLSERNPELFFLTKERETELMQMIRSRLSAFEAKVFGYYLDGLTDREIAEKIGKSPKSVDNAVQRIRRKAALYSGDISKG